MPFAEYLRTSGRIEGWERGRDARICVEFDKELTITFEDWLATHPLRNHVERFEAKMKTERDRFNRYIPFSLF